MREEKSRLVYSTDGPKDLEKTGGKKQKTSGGKGNKTSAASVPSSGQRQKQKLHLRLERKGRGGKTVTLVCGLTSIASQGTSGKDPSGKEMSGSGMEALLNEMKARLGTGGALKDNVLELQGDHRDAITAILKGKGLPI